MAEQVKRRVNSVNKLRGKFEKDHGKGTIVSFNEVAPIERVSIDLPKLDQIFGGGLPKGRIIIYYGKESGGKSSLANWSAGVYQRLGSSILHLEPECAFDPEFTKRTCNYDVTDKETVLFSQEQDINKCYEMMKDAARERIGLIVCDSTDALCVPGQEETQATDSEMGAKARAHSRQLPVLEGIAKDTGTVVIFISQIRYKIGVGANQDPETTAGGQALFFYSSIRARVVRKGWIGGSDNPKGLIMLVKTRKNKVAPPFQKAELNFYFDKGFDPIIDYVTVAIEKDIIHRAGSYYQYRVDTLRTQGKDPMVEHIRNLPEKKLQQFKDLVDGKISYTIEGDAITIEGMKPISAGKFSIDKNEKEVTGPIVEGRDLPAEGELAKISIAGGGLATCKCRGSGCADCLNGKNK